MSEVTAGAPEKLLQAWHALREREPKVRTRHAAAELGVSEAELVATGCGASGQEAQIARRIEADLETLLPGLVALGPLMALTRNDLFVHEKVGVYGDVYVNPHVSSVVGDEIDLRIFPARWIHGCAVARDAALRGGPLGRRSDRAAGRGHRAGLFPLRAMPVARGR